MFDSHPERHTARSDTRTISINASPEELFTFLTDPHNLPQWAVGFCRSIRLDGNDRWIATTPSGEIPISFECNADVRTIDFRFVVAPGLEATAFSRVVPNASGCEYTFTQFQAQGMPDEVFEGQVRALVEELRVLQGVMHARAACQPRYASEHQ